MDCQIILSDTRQTILKYDQKSIPPHIKGELIELIDRLQNAVEQTIEYYKTTVRSVSSVNNESCELPRIKHVWIE
jgi:hypothetical protein